MNAKILINFLEGKEKISSLKKEIETPVKVMKTQMKKRGASIPIEITGDIGVFNVSHRHVKRICDEYLAGNLDEFEVSYIATAMELHEGFKPESEKVEHSIFLLSDPIANGPLDKVNAKIISISLDEE